MLLGGNPVNDANPVPTKQVRSAPATSATGRSNTVAVGGTAQVLAAANANRRGLSVQNTSSGDLYINELGTAAATGESLKIPAGQEYVFAGIFDYVPVSAVSIFGATTAQAFVAREW